MIKNVHGNTVDHLGRAIVAGRYGPDAPIPPEPMLCEELGVSPGQVKTARQVILRAAAQAGLLGEDHRLTRPASPSPPPAPGSRRMRL